MRLGAPIRARFTFVRAEIDLRKDESGSSSSKRNVSSVSQSAFPCNVDEFMRQPKMKKFTHEKTRKAS